MSPLEKESPDEIFEGSYPAAQGGATVLAAAEATFPHLGGNIVATFSLPSFYDNFSQENGITDPALASRLSEALTRFSRS